MKRLRGSNIEATVRLARCASAKHDASYLPSPEKGQKAISFIFNLIHVNYARGTLSCLFILFCAQSKKRYTQAEESYAQAANTSPQVKN